MAGIINRNGRLQLGTVRADGWTQERRALFLDVLAATGSVTQGVEATGMSRTSARALRARDPVFARLWDEALEQAYHRLEEELLAHALGERPDAGEAARAEPINPGPERSEPPVEHRRPFSPHLALAVLRWRDRRGVRRGERAAPPASPAELEEDFAL